MQLLGRLGGLLSVDVTAWPGLRCRPRRLSRRRRGARAALLVLSVVLALPLVARAGSEAPAPSCATPGVGWCVARRFPGTIAKGELGFRFGEPLDVDGDGHADVGAGARFKLQKGTQFNGEASVWSGADGHLIRSWDGEWDDGLFGHWVMPIPDLSGDGLADVVIAAPHARVGGGGQMRGAVVARSPKTGAELWRREETESENLGWDLTLAGDRNGDGVTDLFVGAPSEDTGRVYLLSGKDGTVLRTYAPAEDGGSFGWYVAELDDLDGDGERDLAVGGPSAVSVDQGRVGAAWVFSAKTGKELYHWKDADRRGGFGGVVAGVGDLDCDRTGDVAIAAPGTEDQTRTVPGELHVYSGATGKEIRHWSGTQPGELYGRMVVDVGDIDRDGVDDLAIGAPWHRRGADDRVGRLELRSGRTSKVLTVLFGDEADAWFGWHVRRAPDPDGRGRPALLVGSLRHAVDGKIRVGVLDLYVLRATRTAGHGTKMRDGRRSPIK